MGSDPYKIADSLFPELHALTTWVLYLSRKHCSGCSKEMEEAVLSDDEFNLLKTACLEKVLQKSDPFQSTTPEELAKFEAFMADSEPFDLVIDGLNVSHKQGFKLRRSERVRFLCIFNPMLY